MHDSNTAAGQNPIARVNVNCEYPRNKNSSKNPTSKKNTAQKSANRTIRAPCIARCPTSKTRKPNIKAISDVMLANPHIVPTQNNFPNAARPGSP